MPQADRRRYGFFDVEDLDEVVTAFDLGNSAETSSDLPAAEYPVLVKKIDGLAQAVKKLTNDKRLKVVASAVEFILKVLHHSRKLNCDRMDWIDLTMTLVCGTIAL